MYGQNNKYLDHGKTNLIVLFFCVYAILVCCACYMVLKDDVDFGVVASTKSETVWRVSE